MLFPKPEGQAAATHECREQYRIKHQHGAGHNVVNLPHQQDKRYTQAGDTNRKQNAL